MQSTQTLDMGARTFSFHGHSRGHDQSFRRLQSRRSDEILAQRTRLDRVTWSIRDLNPVSLQHKTSIDVAKATQHAARQEA